MRTYDVITAFSQKACAWQTQRKADKLLLQLKQLLTPEEYTKLSIAHNHYKIGEGSQETYIVCKELQTKYMIILK